MTTIRYLDFKNHEAEVEKMAKDIMQNALCIAEAFSRFADSSEIKSICYIINNTQIHSTSRLYAIRQIREPLLI